MEKQALITIHPEHALNILNRKKTLELRTWNLGDYVGWVNVYVAKRKPYLGYEVTEWDSKWVLVDNEDNLDYGSLNGKVAFRFWYDGCISWIGKDGFYLKGETLDKLCLTQKQVDKYAKSETIFVCEKLYAWNINKLEIFDKPKELGEFWRHLVSAGKLNNEFRTNVLVKDYLTKAPQKMVWVYPKEKENE